MQVLPGWFCWCPGHSFMPGQPWPGPYHLTWQQPPICSACLRPDQSFISRPWETHVLCQTSRPLLHKPPISSDDALSQGLLAQTWYPVRMASSLHQQAPGKPWSMSAHTLPPPLWSLIKSCLLPDTTVDHSRLHALFPKLQHHLQMLAQHMEFCLAGCCLHCTCLISRIMLYLDPLPCDLYSPPSLNQVQWSHKAGI